jgi:hypothetical protein
MNDKPSIRGGRAGFEAAINAAFTADCFHDPIIRYSPSRGFHAESRDHTVDRDVEREAFQYLNTRAEHYRMTRAQIFDEITASA